MPLPLRWLRSTLTRRRLERAHRSWQEHLKDCPGCAVAAHGNRAQRRRLKSRFCAVGGQIMRDVERAIARYLELNPSPQIRL